MSPNQKSAVQEIPDLLLLAAIERAERHDSSDEPGAPVWAIYNHLAIPRRSGARRVGRQLAALQEAGALERRDHRGVQVWQLTTAGRRRLARGRRAGEVGELPESPQHALWWAARTLAGQEIERFREQLQESITAAAGLLEAGRDVSSDEWFEIAERLQRAAWRVGSASYCLYEWEEPDDATVDVEDCDDPADKRFPGEELARRRIRRQRRRRIGGWEPPML